MRRRSDRPPLLKTSRRTRVAAPDFPIASDARLAGDGKQTRFILDLDQPISFHAFPLADPYRVVVDIPAGQFSASARCRHRGARAYQGVPLRPGDAGRLADRVRSDRPGQDCQFLGARGGQRSAAAVGARTGTSRPDRFRSIAFCREPSGVEARDCRRQEAPSPVSTVPAEAEPAPAPPGGYAPVDRHRSRPWRPRQRHAVRQRERKESGAGHLRSPCAIASRRAANTVW